MPRLIIAPPTDPALDHHFSQLQLTLASAEGLLKEDVANLDASVDATVEQFPGVSYGVVKEDYWRDHLAFSHNLRRALFLVCYTEIESYLTDACEIAKQNAGLALSASDLKDRGIQRAKTYLKRLPVWISLLTARSGTSLLPTTVCATSSPTPTDA